ncbi:hypothetical protein WR25_22640 [Diploscapter pachys]|uniref:Uncharacterized protein n=1 Tax=Diploscapter pachys TaxID=2018661 RepID=A0A2A2L6W4_9BILA|nr:hypothetical protein WR25_22640 [Diploscapter pachys]
MKNLLDLMKNSHKDVIEASKKHVIRHMSSQAPSSPAAPAPPAPSKSVSATTKQLVSIPLATIFEPTDIDPLMIPIADINSSRSWDLTRLTIHFAVIKAGLLEQHRRAVSLAALELITASKFMQKLTAILKEVPDIGGDERQENARKCVEDLRELCNESEKYKEKMNGQEQKQFKKLIKRIRPI